MPQQEAIPLTSTSGNSYGSTAETLHQILLQP